MLDANSDGIRRYACWAGPPFGPYSSLFPLFRHWKLWSNFVFRHNRGGTPMAAFQTLLGLGAIHDPTTYDEITELRHAA